jgi:putative transposase
MISYRLIGYKRSSGEVSRCSRELVKAMENWRNRDLRLLKFKHLFCDDVYFEMRVAKSIEKISVLVVIGVTENGQKQVIGIQSGDKESASSWWETFKDLKLRGLNSQTITLGIMDGLSGLEKVFRE